MKRVRVRTEEADLVGRTIVAVELRTFDNGRGGTADDPVIMLDDGSMLMFIVQETEGAYGVKLIHVEKDSG